MLGWSELGRDRAFTTSVSDCRFVTPSNLIKSRPSVGTQEIPMLPHSFRMHISLMTYVCYADNYVQYVYVQYSTLRRFTLEESLEYRQRLVGRWQPWPSEVIQQLLKGTFVSGCIHRVSNLSAMFRLLSPIIFRGGGTLTCTFLPSEAWKALTWFEKIHEDHNGKAQNLTEVL